jgi:hypothetical protein
MTEAKVIHHMHVGSIKLCKCCSHGITDAAWLFPYRMASPYEPNNEEDFVIVRESMRHPLYPCVMVSNFAIIGLFMYVILSGVCVHNHRDDIAYAAVELNRIAFFLEMFPFLDLAASGTFFRSSTTATPHC